MHKKLQSRTGLKKYLNKEVAYTGRIKTIDENNILLLDVKIVGKDKILSDHIWVARGLSLKQSDFKPTDQINLKGCACSYVDSKGVRKYGLTKVYDFCISEIHEKLEPVNHDRRGARLRRKER